MTATANPTFAFKSWGGALSGNGNPKNITMDGVKNVIANFGVAYSCSVSSGTSSTIADVQGFINEALGKASGANDINGDHVVNVADVQIVINAVLFSFCPQ